MDHRDRKPRCTTGLRSTHVSIAVYGLCVCHVQYTPIAPLFLSGKRTFSSSGGAPDVATAPRRRWWESARFQTVFVLQAGSARVALSHPTHLPVPITCSVKGVKRENSDFVFRESVATAPRRRFARPSSLSLCCGFPVLLLFQISSRRLAPVPPCVPTLPLSVRCDALHSCAQSG